MKTTEATTTNPLQALLLAAEGLGLGGEVLVGFRQGALASITLTAEGTEVQVPADDDPAWDWQVLTKTTRH